MKNNLPKYKITIDDEYSEGEDLGISMIAFTSKPAILTKGMAFSSNEPTKLYFVDEVKYRICAPVMIPMEIYRCDSDEEYYVQFTEQEIDTIHKKFMSNLTNKDIFNLEHRSEDVVPAFILEAWIVENPEKDKSLSTYGIKVPKGTLMMTTQVTDKDTYKQLVDNGRIGYSIEGFLGLKLSEVEMKNEPPYHENCKCEMVDGEIITDENVCEYCLEQSNFNINKKNKKNNMEENKLNLPAGEYTSPDGKVFVVAEDGTFTIKETPKEEMAIEVDETAKVEANPGDKTSEEAKKKETELSDEIIEDDVTEEEMAETPTEAMSYTKEEIDEKLNELYKLIADLQVEGGDKKEEVKQDETQLSVHDRFSEFARFMSQNRQ